MIPAIDEFSWIIALACVMTLNYQLLEEYSAITLILMCPIIPNTYIGGLKVTLFLRMFSLNADSCETYLSEQILFREIRCSLSNEKLEELVCWVGSENACCLCSENELILKGNLEEEFYGSQFLKLEEMTFLRCSLELTWDPETV